MKFDEKLSELVAALKSEPNAERRSALVRESISRLRAITEPQITTGHCREKAKPGGCQLHNLHCGYPKCDQRAVPANA